MTYRGRFEEVVFESEVLKDNPLNDPWRRPLWIYLPPGYDSATRPYPSIYILQGLTAQLDMWRNRLPFRKTFLELADELFAREDVPPAVLVWVDAWTSVGGSQFIDSVGTGRYQTYLCDEIVPWVDGHFNTRPSRDHRGIAGHSSGGFGAAVSAMLRPEVFGGFASHAGDALFEVSLLPNFRDSIRVLNALYGGSFAAFWSDFRARVPMSRSGDSALILDWALAACFSPAADGTPLLPYDTRTGQLIPDVWKRWLDWDPVRMAPRCVEALRSMRAIYLDAGRQDEFYLDLGTAAFQQAIQEAGVDSIHVELFDGPHAPIHHRYPIGLRYLVERLSPDVLA